MKLKASFGGQASTWKERYYLYIPIYARETRPMQYSVKLSLYTKGKSVSAVVSTTLVDRKVSWTRL